MVLLACLVLVVGFMDSCQSFSGLSALHQRILTRKTAHHCVDGIDCREIVNQLPTIGTVVILEATAASQDKLVDLALEEGDDLDFKLDSGDPYGAVLWPAASAVATYLIEHDMLAGRTVVELGTGTGLVALAATMAGANRVIATDYESIPLRLLSYASQELNVVEAGVLSTQLFDICDSDVQMPSADLVVAADIMYKPKTGRMMARRAMEALQAGSSVVVGDSPGRAGRPAFLQELNRLGVKAEFIDVVGSTVVGERHDLICGMGSPTVSDKPRALSVAILDLDPKLHLRR